MKKLKITFGHRDGWIYECSGKFGEPNYREELKATFSSNRSRFYLRDELYSLIRKNIVKELATVTRTGNTKVVLVNDDFFEIIKPYDQMNENGHRVLWFE